MTRRSLLGFLTSAAAAAVADPERLLWQPGRKLISIPKPQHWGRLDLAVGDSVTVEGLYWVAPNGDLHLIQYTVAGVTQHHVVGEAYPYMKLMPELYRRERRRYRAATA